MNRYYLSLFLILAIPLIHADDDLTQKLSVTGISHISKPADKVSIILSVETHDKEVEKATKINAEKMTKVVKALTEIGLTEKEVQTKDFTIIPVHTTPPKNPPENWQPSIAGYQVRNTLEVITTRLNLIAPIIDKTTVSGINNIDSISFSLSEEEEGKLEAISKATRQAQVYAEAAAKEAGVNLGDILEISIGNSDFHVGGYKALRTYGEATPILSNEVDLSANVSIIYEIDSEKRKDKEHKEDKEEKTKKKLKEKERDPYPF